MREHAISRKTTANNLGACRLAYILQVYAPIFNCGGFKTGYILELLVAGKDFKRDFNYEITA